MSICVLSYFSSSYAAFFFPFSEAADPVIPCVELRGTVVLNSAERKGFNATPVSPVPDGRGFRGSGVIGPIPRWPENIAQQIPAHVADGGKAAGPEHADLYSGPERSLGKPEK